MNNKALRNLAIVLCLLVAILVGMELADDSGTSATGRPLFDGLRAGINEVDTLTVERADAEAVIIRRADAGWVVENRDGYPADVARVRNVLLALADAVVLEEKTANPDRYDALGVRDPGLEGSAGVRLTASAGDERYAVVIGKSAQGAGRYARIADEAGSVLIDKSPDLPGDAGGWLDTSLLDIATRDVRAVRIEHADGETIAVSKPERGATEFAVADIPAGRELSYPTVANSVGGALSGLALEDVRRPAGGTPDTVTTFTTFDGLVIRVAVYAGADEESWAAISASAEPSRAEAEAEAEAEADTDVDAEAEADAGESAAAAETPADAGEVAAGINSRLSGWEFRLPSFRTGQLTRRWDDMLADAGDE